MKVDYINRVICMAPLLGCTDKHFRYLLRLISPNILSFTEMLKASEIVSSGDVQSFSRERMEQLVVGQISGNNPFDLATSAKILQDLGYSEINLNIGCPGRKVTAAGYGVCLMAKPDFVGDCIEKIKAKINIPISVKTRVGINDNDNYDFVKNFIEKVSKAGCDIFYIHARKAILDGITTTDENHKIPPLRYEVVYKIKQDFPDLTIVINGGIQNIDQINQHLSHVDGVMIGRAIYNNPFFLADIEDDLYGYHKLLQSRREIVNDYKKYLDYQLGSGTNLEILIKPIFNLFFGTKIDTYWKRLLNLLISNYAKSISKMENSMARFDRLWEECQERLMQKSYDLFYI